MVEVVFRSDSDTLERGIVSSVFRADGSDIVCVHSKKTGTFHVIPKSHLSLGSEPSFIPSEKYPRIEEQLIKLIHLCNKSITSNLGGISDKGEDGSKFRAQLVLLVLTGLFESYEIEGIETYFNKPLESLIKEALRLN